MTATCSICNADTATANAADARRQTPPHLELCRLRVKTPRVVAAVALNSLTIFPGIVSLRLRPTCLPLTILAAAISLSKIPEGLCAPHSVLLSYFRPRVCENFRAVIGAGLSNDLAPMRRSDLCAIYTVYL